ncbi:NodZ family protein [Desulfovibrio sp. X2]|uniref:nodulation protein NodZ n=1 Tax=Desulfovibrio sp. X2 TaxID=941449 RepID=UPI000358E35D|nr:nodulation protein NodZ [Desulfovibrio sp. X2]EPR37354.1 NodZ family protein [Desulfovibrio sp. X2]
MAKYIVVKGSGGMSNRLQAAAAAVPYALLTGRTLCVDWRDSLYSDDASNTFTRYFDIAGVPYVDAPPASDDIFPVFWRERLALPVAVEYLFDNDHFDPEVFAATRIDLARTDYENEVLVFWAPGMEPLQGLLPRLAALPEFSAFPGGPTLDQAGHVVLSRHIRPTGDVVRAVDGYAKLLRHPAVGVHVRHTDLESPVDRILEEVRELVARTGAQVFLCTDNLHVQTLFKRLFPDLLVTDKYLSPANEPLHGLIEGVSNVRKGMEALTDMYLLGRCEYVVHYAKSSFARISILATPIPSGNVVAIP